MLCHPVVLAHKFLLFPISCTPILFRRHIWKPAERASRRVLAAFALVSVQSQSNVEMLGSVAGILVLAAAAALAQKPPGRCPESYGVQTYPNENACDRFYKVRKDIKSGKTPGRPHKAKKHFDLN